MVPNGSANRATWTHQLADSGPLGLSNAKFSDFLGVALCGPLPRHGEDGGDEYEHSKNKQRRHFASLHSFVLLRFSAGLATVVLTSREGAEVSLATPLSWPHHASGRALGKEIGSQAHRLLLSRQLSLS